MKTNEVTTARPGCSRGMSDETFGLTVASVDLYAAIDALSLQKVLELVAVAS